MSKLTRKILTTFWRLWYRHHPEPSRFTEEEALTIARKHKLETEVAMAMKQGLTPDEALKDWDLFPFCSTNKTEGK